MKTNFLDFLDLDSMELVTVPQFVRTLAEHLVHGHPVSASIVHRILEKMGELNRSDANILLVMLQVGEEYQVEHRRTRAAREYRLLMDYMRGKYRL